MVVVDQKKSQGSWKNQKMKSHRIFRIRGVEKSPRFWRNMLARAALGDQKVLCNKICLSAGPVSLMRGFNSYVRRMYAVELSYEEKRQLTEPGLTETSGSAEKATFSVPWRDENFVSLMQIFFKSKNFFQNRLCTLDSSAAVLLRDVLRVRIHSVSKEILRISWENQQAHKHFLFPLETVTWRNDGTKLLCARSPRRKRFGQNWW